LTVPNRVIRIGSIFHDGEFDMKPIEMPGVQTRLTEEEEQKLLEVLRTANTLSTGPEGEAFEKEFTEFMGCGDSVSVNSCTSALEISAALCELKPDDEVIIPAHTFVSSAVPFARTGAKIKWADVDPDTRVLSAQSVEKLLTDKTRVVVVVHLYGLPADMDAILEVTEPKGIMVVEDCAQAPGAKYKGKRVGSIGHFGCFSFHTHKNMTTLGEGGMLTARDPAQGEAARKLRWMGNWPFSDDRKRYWEPAMSNLVEPMPGRWPANYCVGEPNCAVGRMLLKRLDDINQNRRDQAARFMGAFSDYPELSFQKVPEECEHAYHLMAARYDGDKYGKSRDDLIEVLFEKYKVKAIVQYWPLYRSELFMNLGLGDAEVPEGDRFFDNMVSFPWWSYMPTEVLDDMAERTKKALEDMRSS
jgi:dTDP-4-amino-4,6-dideoxygalactose transaminase